MLIAELEARLDCQYLTLALPSPNKSQSKWYVVMVAEDLLLNIWRSDQNLHKISVFADGFKYSVKHALLRIDAELNDTTDIALPTAVDPAKYIQTNDLLLAGMDYASATKICTFVHEGILSITVEGNKIFIQEDFFWKNPKYSALEMLNGADDAQPLLVLKALQFLNNPKITKFYLSLKDLCVISAAGLVSYRYDPEKCLQFSSEVPQFRSIIPENWIFPWCSGKVATKLLWALNVRCLFHLVTIRTAAAFHSIAGGAHESLCLITEHDVLAKELADLAKVNLPDAAAFLKAITIGHATRTSDPALQPLITLEGKKILVGCLHVLTCRQDRNLLALHARAGQQSFDAQSSIFETQMISDLAKIAATRKMNFRCNIHIPGAKNVGDLDMIFFDSRSRTMLICELRWMIQPGDPREILNRAKACEEKVQKIGAKVAAAEARREEIARVLFGESIKHSEWQVRGVIVIEGYGGIESSNPELPIITKRVFMEALKSFTKISDIYAWTKSLSWLPKEELHFQRETIVTEVEGYEMERAGFSLLPDAENYLSHVKASIKRFK